MGGTCRDASGRVQPGSRDHASLRPNAREIEEFFRDQRRTPGRWSNVTAAGGTLFGLLALLIGVMLVMFGVGLLLLA